MPAPPIVEMSGQLWRYRRYILGGALVELRQRYAGSAIGILWHVVTPLAQILIYGIVFSQLLRERGGARSETHYSVFLCAGLLPWLVFSECLNRGSSILLASENYLRKLAIPEVVFVAQSVATSAMTLGMYSVALLIMAWAMGIPPTAAWLVLPLVMLLFLALCFGFALILSTVSVFFRDVVQVTMIATQVWFWITPIVYDMSVLRPGLRRVVEWNPPSAYITSTREILLRGTGPALEEWAWMLGFSAAFLYLGTLILGRLRSDLRDAL
jgi:lipopolysaccharide transport system permease protein